jgi:hypothetical protein
MTGQINPSALAAIATAPLISLFSGGASQMFWLGAFAVLLGPSILAQLRGHHAAGLIILLNLSADAALFYCMFHSDRDNTWLGLPMLFA